MILTDEEVEDKLKSPDNLMNKLSVLRIDPGGRRVGDTNIPPMVKDLIATIDTDESDTEIAEAFGISQPAVSAIRRGLSGGGNNASVDHERLAKIKSVKGKIDTAHEAALDCLVSSLTLLKPKLPEITKPKELARIASDMSKAISNLRKKDEDADQSRIQVVVFAPPQHKETHYKTIDV